MFHLRNKILNRNSDTFGPFNLLAAVSEAGAVVVQAEVLMNVMYAHLESAYMSVFVALATCGSYGPQTRAFFRELGGHL